MQIIPDRSNFEKLAKKHNLIVLSHKFYCDWLTPVAAYHGLARFFKQKSFLLESVEGEDKICRYSFLGFGELCSFKSRGRTIEIDGVVKRRFETDTDPVDELKKLVKTFSVAPKEHLRFFGGFVGYLGYDLVRFYEPVGEKKEAKLGAYDTYLILPEFLVIFDHVKKQIEILHLVSVSVKNGAASDYRKACAALEIFYARISAPRRLVPLGFISKKLDFKSNYTKKEFCEAVEKGKHHIKEGDIIQVVLSQRLSVKFNKNPFSVYRYLRVLNPSPYMFYLDFKGIRLCGSSPEMLLRCEGGELITHPIAGTRPRANTDIEDNRLAAELLGDIKEKAEHIMLVDLARNDLGKVAKPASVSVPEFMKVEKFSHVMHIVSEVRAKLSATQDIFSAFVSCFPAGTLSGAPKVRAMQIITEIEPMAREIYGGAVGYFSFTNSLDTCIIIRTVIFKDGMAYIQAGAGIVYDSQPEKEYKETLNKAKAQLLTLELAAGEGK